MREGMYLEQAIGSSFSAVVTDHRVMSKEGGREGGR